jgi:hypothetical protein
MQTQYKKVSSIGSNSYTLTDNPVTSCIGDTLEQRFTHGGSATQLGQNCRNCQLFMSQYCAEGWDKYCDIAESDKTEGYPNTMGNCSKGFSCFEGLTSGEILLVNTAERKYLVETRGCQIKSQPFDPNVATSPNVYSFVDGCNNTKCVMFLEVDPSKIESDIVMNKILEKPSIGMGILSNIYNTMKAKKTLSSLAGTSLGHFFNTNHVFKNKGGLHKSS